jgi:hypothetical protein
MKIFNGYYHDHHTEIPVEKLHPKKAQPTGSITVDWERR